MTTCDFVTDEAQTCVEISHVLKNFWLSRWSRSIKLKDTIPGLQKMNSTNKIYSQMKYWDKILKTSQNINFLLTLLVTGRFGSRLFTFWNFPFKLSSYQNLDNSLLPRLDIVQWMDISPWSGILPCNRDSSQTLVASQVS